MTAITYARDTDVGRLTLAGVRRNAIDLAFIEDLQAAVAAAGADAGCRALLVTADGPTFTVGGDLTYMAERADDLGAALDGLLTGFHAAIGAYATLDVPVVCAAQGAAAGGGLGLLWPADVVLVADDFKLATGFHRIGLTGDGMGSWWLPRLVGVRRAQELMLEGRVLDAREAVDWGIATRVVPVADLAAEAERTAAALAAGPTVALSRIRGLLRDSLDTPFAQRLAEEHEAMVSSGETADAAAGIRAFVARERPEFRGR